jgi:tartrate dehydrogenase/decarboxylase / D-malate dehydrogenase
MTIQNHRIALIPGDGIGTEVLPPAQRVLDAVGRRHGIGFSYTSYDWSCERYVREGSMMPEDGLDRLREADSILLGAVGVVGAAAVLTTEKHVVNH